uniref:Uncharacterized protein n=1 Tax=Globisporangium ultimum (strain ATCC 200006 / CBS 805.95 / DAOM BR144) TaxID=431595 RepID=K3WTG0_GLOUD
MMPRVLAKRALLLAQPARTSLATCAAVNATRAFASKAQDAAEALRPIHFEQEESDAAARPFKIVGVRDVEVEDWEYPTRVEAEKKSRTLRNRFNHPNFISLWVDKLALVEEFLQKEKIPYSSEGIVKGPDGHDVLVLPPAEGSIEFFNLCDNPTLVELVQATPEVIKEFEDEGDDE